MTARGEQLQLSLDVSNSRQTLPDASTFKVGGALISVERQLLIGDQVSVVISNADGEVILSAAARTSAVGFKRHKATKSKPSWLERLHTIAIADPGEDE